MRKHVFSVMLRSETKCNGSNSFDIKYVRTTRMSQSGIRFLVFAERSPSPLTALLSKGEEEKSAGPKAPNVEEIADLRTLTYDGETLWRLARLDR